MQRSSHFCRAEAVSLFLSYFKTLSIGPVLEHSTSCSAVKCSTYLARSAYHKPPCHNQLNSTKRSTLLPDNDHNHSCFGIDLPNHYQCSNGIKYSQITTLDSSILEILFSRQFFGLKDTKEFFFILARCRFMMSGMMKLIT